MPLTRDKNTIFRKNIDGWFYIESNGSFQEETLSIVILCETKNSFGGTALDRRYAWRSSWHYGKEHKTFMSVDLESNFSFFIAFRVYKIFFSIFRQSHCFPNSIS